MNACDMIDLLPWYRKYPVRILSFLLMLFINEAVVEKMRNRLPDDHWDLGHPPE